MPVDRHIKEPRFDHKQFLNQAVRTDSWVNHRGATIPNIVMNQSIGSSDFNDDMYSGGGSKWWKNQHNKWNFTTDNLTVRGTMWIWELLINQLRASNGTVIISSCAKVEEDGAHFNSGVSWDLVFESNSGSANLQPFAVDDIIIAKRFTMPNDGSNPSTLIEVVGIVTAISVNPGTGVDHARITIDVDGGYTTTPIGGLEFVRIGNTTDTSRQGSIVLTSDGIDSGGSATVPYIDVYDGIDSRAKFLDKDYVKARLGRLDEITGNTNEFGLLTSHLHLIPSTSSTGVSFTYYETTNPPGGTMSNYNNGDTWYNEVTGIVWKFVALFAVSGTWIPYRTYTDETGQFFNAEAPSGDGFYGGSGHFGFYKSGAWWIYMDSDGDAHFGKDGSDVFKYDNSDNKVIIGDSGLTGQRIEFQGSDGEIKFYDDNGDLRISFDSSVGSGNYAGISLDGGTIAVKPRANAASGFGFESTAYSIDNTKNRLGFRSEFATNNGVAAWSAGSDIVNFYAGTYLVGGSMDVVGYGGSVSGTSSGSLKGADIFGRDYGGYFVSDKKGLYGFVDSNVSSVFGVGGYALSTHNTGLAIGTKGESVATGTGGSISIGIFGTASGNGEVWAGYFEAGDVRIENTLWVGSSKDTNLYRDSANILKTDDSFFVGGVIYVGNFDTNLYRAEANVLKTDDSFHIASNLFLGSTPSQLSTGAGGEFVFADDVEVSGYVDASGGFRDNGTTGIDSIGFVIAVGDTITVRGGIITALSH